MDTDLFLYEAKPKKYFKNTPNTLQPLVNIQFKRLELVLPEQKSP